MTTWSINASWAGDNLGFTEMMTALHTGDYRTVNLYIRNFGTVDFGGSWYVKSNLLPLSQLFRGT